MCSGVNINNAKNRAKYYFTPSCLGLIWFSCCKNRANPSCTVEDTYLFIHAIKNPVLLSKPLKLYSTLILQRGQEGKGVVFTTTWSRCCVLE